MQSIDAKTLMATQELLDVSEACLVSRLSRPTLYRHIAAGNLPLVKLGRRSFVRTDDLKAFLAGGASHAAAR
jgi:excisionase family DNA binding protein